MLLNAKSVGVVGDERAYEYCFSIESCELVRLNGMTGGSWFENSLRNTG
nr:hypothetical protein [Kosmotoga sp. DU53]